MNEKDIVQEIYLRVKEDLIKLGVPISNEICPNIRLSKAKRKWGSCKQFNKNEKWKYEISISENCFKEPDYIRFISDTMAHELIHTVKGCFNHGVMFKKYSEVVLKGGYRVTTTSGSSVEKTEKDMFEEANYVLKCVECGQLFYRFRMPKKKGYVNKIRCGRCGGCIVRVK